jgi:hypothetical protein
MWINKNDNVYIGFTTWGQLAALGAFSDFFSDCTTDGYACTQDVLASAIGANAN